MVARERESEGESLLFVRSLGSKSHGLEHPIANNPYSSTHVGMQADSVFSNPAFEERV